MKATLALLILSLAGASQAGYIGNGATFSVRMPFTNPAGVTYIEGPAPAGLAAGPLVQSAGVYSAVSPVPRFAHVATPLPLAYSAAHVKTASVGYAAVPTVQHVPAVQDVPFTRIEATPGFVHKQVDVAKPAIATRKFEVRRPAIQKEFYDIEERVVVRPAGSAVVELDQPLSKTQKGDTIIQTPAVAVAPVARVAAVAPVAYAGFAPTVAKYSPFLYQSAHLTQPIIAAHLPQALPTPLPSDNPDQPTQPTQPAQPPQSTQEPQQQFEQPQQQFEQPQQQFEQPQQQFEQPQQQFEQPQQQFEQPQQSQQDNSDDTVEVGNPEISGRSAAPQTGAAPAPRVAPQQPAPQEPAPQEDSLRLIKAEEEAIETQRQQLAARMAQLDEARRQQELDAANLLARQRSLNAAAAAAVNPASFRSPETFSRQSQLSQSQLTQARFFPQTGLPPQAQPQPQAEARSAEPQPQSQPQEQSQPQPAQARSSQPNVEIRSLGSPAESLVPTPRTGDDVVPSVRNLTPEQNQENQQRLIELLTARGGVAEVGNQARAAAVASAALDAGQVRARVLSATPAPPGAEPTNERVSTRRVVVSRPIQTIQEVDIVEPFTKIHRLSVQQPAFFKTARVDVARVHTAVPVLGKALTPYTVYH